MTNSVDLLKAEVEREEALLAKETKQLEELEKNAKRAEAERKRQMKNVRRVPLLTVMAYIADVYDKEHPVLRQLDDLSSSSSRDQRLGKFAGQIKTDGVALCDVWHRFSVSEN